MVFLLSWSSAHSPKKSSRNPALAIKVWFPLSKRPLVKLFSLVFKEDKSESVWSNLSESNFISKFFFWIYVFSIILSVLFGLGLNSLLNAKLFDKLFRKGIDLYASKLLKLIEK